MPRQLDPKIGTILKQHGFGPEAVWDCHGVWVVYHRALEQIAASAGIKFDPPMVIEANGMERLAAICVTGHTKDKSEWSIGEASPHNYKTTGKQQPYPWAMAEKRAKDRVILKLIGLHGFVYSEEEADDFKPNGHSAPPSDPRVITEDHVTIINDLIKEVGANKDAFLKYFNVASVSELPSGSYEQAISALEKKRKKAA